MKKAFKWLGIAVGAVIVVLGAFLASVAVQPLPHYPTPRVEFTVDADQARVVRGKRTVEMLCVGCHLDSATGALTGKRMPDLPPQFGEGWSRNITGHKVKGIGAWTDGEIAYLLRTGVA